MEEAARTADSLTSRNALIGIMPTDCVFVEVGVANGVFTKDILRIVKPKKLYLVDLWRNQPGTEWQKKDPAAQEDHEAYYCNVRNLYGANPNVEIIRNFSVVASAMFDAETLDAVYIDADHTRTAEDILAWWPKIKKGGWISGHDYVMDAWITTKSKVDEFASLNSAFKLIITNEEFPSWAIKKPY